LGEAMLTVATFPDKGAHGIEIIKKLILQIYQYSLVAQLPVNRIMVLHREIFKVLWHGDYAPVVDNFL
jgi:hypothetical protein